jgi:hypothetical protein
MKTLMSVMIIVFAVSSVGVEAEEYNFEAADPAVETTLCMAALTNDVQQLKKVLRRSGERLAIVRDSVKCNAMPIAEFAEQYGFMQTARYIVSDKKVEVIASLGE